jgi:hypothetical protein
VQTANEGAHLSAAGRGPGARASCLLWYVQSFPCTSRPCPRWHEACTATSAWRTCAPRRGALGTRVGARRAPVYGSGGVTIMPVLMPPRHQHAGEAPCARVMPDFGDVQDNATALTMALDALASGSDAGGATCCGDCGRTSAGRVTCKASSGCCRRSTPPSRHVLGQPHAARRPPERRKQACSEAWSDQQRPARCPAQLAQGGQQDNARIAGTSVNTPRKA